MGILNIFGINSNLPNIEVSFISLKRSFARIRNFVRVLPVRLSNYMWSFIKFRQLVKSQETIVIFKKIKIYLLSIFSLYSLLLNWLATRSSASVSSGDPGDRRG